MSENQKKLRGYGFSRRAHGEFAPQRIQNMIIRQYVEGKGAKFLLSAFEYYMDDCYMMLDALLDQLDEGNGLAFYSVNFLPENKERRLNLYQRILSKGKELHFALENLTIVNETDVLEIEDIFAFRSLSQVAG